MQLSLKSVKKELAILSVPLLALFVFVKWIRISVWCHSLSAWRTCFSSFRKMGLFGSNDLHGCCSENVFISPSFWKSSLRDRSFWLTYFVFHPFEYVILPPSGFTNSKGKSAVDLINVPLYVLRPFFLAPFKIFVFENADWYLSGYGSLSLSRGKFLTFLGYVDSFTHV